MPDRLFPTVLNFQGGYATDLAPQVRELTYLRRAENLIYEVSGAVRKVGGSSRINSVAIAGGPDVLGMYDFWLTGTVGSSTQKFMAVTSDGKVYKEDMDGVFDDITGAAVIGGNAYPVFAMLTDLLSIWFSDASTPLKWNQTGNVATLGGTPPLARVACQHLNRMWVTRTNANASRLFHSAFGNIEDWTGPDTGSIDIDLNDGDENVGLASNRGRLFVFKGPHKGSLHQISGTAPTGSDAWSRQVLMRGLPIHSHNAIVEVGDDLWFPSDRGIHSLSATQKFGNFEGADLSRFLKGFFRDEINRARLSKSWGVHYAEKQCAVWTLTRRGQSEEDLTFGLSYIRLVEEGRLKAFTWPGRGCLSAAIRVNPSGSGTLALRKELIFGSTDGFARRQDTVDRNIDGATAYTMTVETPHVLLAATDSQGKPAMDQPVKLHRAVMRSVGVGNYDVTVNLTRDTELSSETYTFNQGNTGFQLGVNQLGIGRLGGVFMRTTVSPLEGEARSVKLTMTQGGLNQDANVHEIGIEWTPTAKASTTTLA